MAVAGPIAATAQDLVLAYRTMAQPDPDCPIQGTFSPSIPPSLSSSSSSSSSKKYIGIYRPWWERADPRVSAVCDRAVSWLSSHKNYEIVPIYIPYVDVGQLAHGGTCLAEMADSARSRPNDPHEWLQLVTPATRLLLMVGSQTPAQDYLKYAALRELLMQHMAFLFQKYPGLLVVTPTTAVAGWKRTPGDETHGLSDGNATIRAMTYIWLANSTGCPAVSAPVGYVEPDAGEGRLPVGLMAMGEWGAEEQLLEWAGETEEYLHGGVEGGRARPAEWVDVIERAIEVRKTQ
jgi:Asp-tRNA(Asn)/Glu-tRNA(Gln) amidotransferase A subunit family amidase